MPFMKNGKRDYKRELAWEKKATGKGRQDDRVSRNAARAAAIEAGTARKGDGKDVDHKTPLSKGGGNSSKNLRVVSAGSNRSFARNKDGSMKSQTSKREKR
jgi:5-methylcytosine-specific restriction endonuclease McrA